MCGSAAQHYTWKEIQVAVISFLMGALGGRGGSFYVCIKQRFGLLQRKGILVVKNAGAHPASLGQVHDVEAAMTLSVSCLVQTKPLALSDVFDAVFLCVISKLRNHDSCYPALCRDGRIVNVSQIKHLDGHHRRTSALQVGLG